MKIKISKSTYSCKNTHHQPFSHYAEKRGDVDFIPVNIVKCDSCGDFSYFGINDPYYLLITNHFYKKKMPGSPIKEMEEKYAINRKKAIMDISKGQDIHINLHLYRDNKYVKKMEYYQNAVPIWINQNILKSKETISLFEETIDKCKNCNGTKRVSLFSCPICFERPDKSKRIDFEILGLFDLSPVIHNDFTGFVNTNGNNIFFSRFTFDEFKENEEKYVSILRSENFDLRKNQSAPSSGVGAAKGQHRSGREGVERQPKGA